jgi:hypothetical protein
MYKWIFIICVFCFLIPKTYGSEVNIFEEEVSSDHFFKIANDLETKYTCEVDKASNNYQFLMSVLDLESSELDDLSKSEVLSKDSLKFIDELMLAKTQIDNELTSVLCIKNKTALVLFKYNASSNNSGFNFGILQVAKYKFVNEGNSLKLVLPQTESKDNYWYTMRDTVNSNVFYKIRIANKALKQDK